jgi:hypothetical protein
MRNLDRIPEGAAGVSVITAVSAQFAADPLGTIAALVAIFAGVIASIASIIRLWKDIRDWK